MTENKCNVVIIVNTSDILQKTVPLQKNRFVPSAVVPTALIAAQDTTENASTVLGKMKMT